MTAPEFPSRGVPEPRPHAYIYLVAHGCVCVRRFATLSSEPA